ncbi:hypothetical protein P7K49_012043 [Saguinus oedipus]|uniref:Uncharacterized protein n=1 Tax=Saguinus oedipus TaxID=9490 RepID=A0ABQ9VT29_SAGOE|nr:hypothetical protein P7K49_012043 [Saguinus oedipus]
MGQVEQHHGPWGITESGVTNQKAGGRWERKPKNKPARAEEENGRRPGGRRRSSSEQRLPGVSVLTLWTPACRCHCEQSTGRLPSCTLLPATGGTSARTQKCPFRKAQDKGGAQAAGRGGCSPGHQWRPQLPSPTLPLPDVDGASPMPGKGQGPGAFPCHWERARGSGGWPRLWQG